MLLAVPREDHRERSNPFPDLFRRLPFGHPQRPEVDREDVPALLALERAMDFIELEIDEQTKALQAMLGARREAEVRLADLELSLSQHAPQETGRAAGPTKTMSAERAMAAIARVTGVPASQVLGDKELDELDRLHREKEIAARLARIKSQQ